MQKKNLLTILLIQICMYVNGQNLVPNNSFENYGVLPCSWIVPPQSNFSNAMQNWIMPTDGSTDVFSTLVPTSCFANCLSVSSSAVGQQLPRTGNVMSAILTYGTGGSPVYREYLEVMLTSPLIIGRTYYAEMYVSHTDYSQHASNNIGMYFSDTLISIPGMSTTLNYSPQINENSIVTNDTGWVQISGTFTATSPAQYLVIGNFYDNISTSTIYYPTHAVINARYFVDDVSVIEVIPCIVASDDTTICQGNSAILLAQSDSLIGWAVDSVPIVLISTDSVLITTPLVTTTYLVLSNCDTISVTVNVISQPIINLGNDTTLCQGQTVVLNGGSATSYLWSNGSTASSIITSTSGTYWVQGSNGQCSSTDSINITFNSAPIVNLGSDTTLCQGQTITLSADSATSYLWSNGLTTSSINVSTSGTYWVQANNGLCSNSDTLSVLIANCAIEIELPNVFTPNNDGINDNFVPIKYKGIIKANLNIYNRWGEKLFSTDNLILGWNGYSESNICTAGVYFWMVQYTTIMNEQKDMIGYLTLIK